MVCLAKLEGHKFIELEDQHHPWWAGFPKDLYDKQQSVYFQQLNLLPNDFLLFVT